MTRADAEQTINTLYGFPGESWDSDLSVAIAAQVLSEFGLDALTDNAVIALAIRHRAIDDGMTRAPEPR